MIRRMLDILVCPFDKESELELYEFKIRNMVEATEIDKNKDVLLSGDRSSKDIIIEEGILFCNKCLRFYPIVEEIPIILPDDLRDKNKDMDLLHKWSKSLPEKIIKKALPWHL